MESSAHSEPRDDPVTTVASSLIEIFFVLYFKSFFICLFGVLLYFWFVNYHSLRHVAQQNLKQNLNRYHIYWDISSFLENVILLLQGSPACCSDNGRWASCRLFDKKVSRNVAKIPKETPKDRCVGGWRRGSKRDNAKQKGRQKKSCHLQFANQQSRRTCGCWENLEILQQIEKNRFTFRNGF